MAPLLRAILWGILAVSLVRIWRGNPGTIWSTHTSAGKILLESLYFSSLYLILFSYSRTLSVRSALRWFYVGMVGVTGAFALLHLSIYKVGPANGHHPFWGYWSDKYSGWHRCIFSPLLSEGLKALFLFFFLWRAVRKKTVHSYSISDWALMGFLLGTGFHFAENAMRIQQEIYGVDFSWPKGVSDWLIPMWPATKSLGLFGKTFTVITGIHGVQSGLIGLAIGLTLFLRRRGWPALTTLLVPGVIFWTMLDHALYNLAGQSAPWGPYGWVQFLYAVTLGGWLEVYLFGLGMFALAGFELWLVHRRWNSEHLKGIGRHLWFCLRIGTATMAGTFAAVWKGIRHPVKWLIPVRVPVTFLTGIWIGLNALLEHLNSQWALTRVRHAVAWSGLSAPARQTQRSP